MQLSLKHNRMNTKLSQIEKSLKLKYRLEKDGNHGGTGGGGPSTGGVGSAGVGGDGGGFGHPRNRENEQLVEELHRYNGLLLRENSDLKTKIKVTPDCFILQSIHCRQNSPRDTFSCVFSCSRCACTTV